MIRALLRFALFVTFPIARFRNWCVRQEIADNARRMRRAFPSGTRVVVGSGCGCGSEFVGRHGVVSDLSSFGGEGPDYRVYLDGDLYDGTYVPSLVGVPRYQLICARALTKET